MSELKPCPFCGASNEEVYEDDYEKLDIRTWFKEVRFEEYEIWTVECEVCGANVGWNYDTEEKAIEAWNRRAHE